MGATDDEFVSSEGYVELTRMQRNMWERPKVFAKKPRANVDCMYSIGPIFSSTGSGVATTARKQNMIILREVNHIRSTQKK